MEKVRAMLLFSDDWPWSNEKTKARAAQHSADNHTVKELATEILKDILPYVSAKLAKKQATHYREFWSEELQQVSHVRRRGQRNKGIARKNKDAHKQVL